MSVTGKTTLINNVFRFYHPSGKPFFEGHEPPKTLLEHFDQPSLRASLQHEFTTEFIMPGSCDSQPVKYFIQVRGETTHRCCDDGLRVDVTALLHAGSQQDTPGYGDDLNVSNSISTVVSHVVDQHKAWRSEQDSIRKQILTHNQDGDTRYDVCLYFISPHRYRGIDVSTLIRPAAYCAVWALMHACEVSARSGTLSYR